MLQLNTVNRELNAPPLPPGKFKTIFNVLNMRLSIYYCVLVIIQDKVTIVIGEK